MIIACMITDYNIEGLLVNICNELSIALHFYIVGYQSQHYSTDMYL